MELLTIGPQPVSVIAKRVSLNRTTGYSILRTLGQKGLVSHCQNNNVRFFVANDPNCLVGFLDSKCRTYDYCRNDILENIPKLRSMMASYAFKKPIVGYYDGIEGVKHLMYDSLKTKGDFCEYLCLDKWFKSGMKDFVLNYKDFRIATKKIPLRAIVPDTKLVRSFFEENYEKNSPLTKVLYVKKSSSSKMFENCMRIYDDKVAIIHLDKGEEYGVVIQGKEIAAMHKAIFEMAWKGLGGVL